MINSVCGCFCFRSVNRLFTCPCECRLPWRSGRAGLSLDCARGRAHVCAHFEMESKYFGYWRKIHRKLRHVQKVWTINWGSLKCHIKRRGRRSSRKWADGSSVLVIPQSQMDRSVGHYFPLGPDKWVLTPFSVQISCCYHSHYYYQDQTIYPATLSEKQNAPSFQAIMIIQRFMGTGIRWESAKVQQYLNILLPILQTVLQLVSTSMDVCKVTNVTFCLCVFLLTLCQKEKKGGGELQKIVQK